MSLEVKRGRSGISGWWGGRSELMKLIFGAETPRGGEISVFGKQVVIQSPIDAIRSGITALHRRQEGARHHPHPS